MVRDSGAISMAYDAEGRLRQTVINAPGATTRNQPYDGVNLVADYDGTDILMRRYIHGPGVDEPRWSMKAQARPPRTGSMPTTWAAMLATTWTAK